MRELLDTGLMDTYIRKYRIRSLFDTEQLPFRLYRFEKGEILNNIKVSSDYLQFMVKGTIDIYADRSDGSRYPLGRIDEFAVLGDVEFCNAAVSPFLMEAKTTVLCVALPLRECKETLSQDNRILRFLLQSVSEKLSLFSKSEADFSGLEEKLLYYMQVRCPEGRITNIGKTAFQLHCSRRQVQRILRKLTEQGRIQKCSRGNYRLYECCREK